MNMLDTTNYFCIIAKITLQEQKVIDNQTLILASFICKCFSMHKLSVAFTGQLV